MPDLPSGTVTFLFTDIEGSTAFWEGDRVAMARRRRAPSDALRAATERHGGRLFKIVGDAVQAAFPTAPDAVGRGPGCTAGHCCNESWPDQVGAPPVPDGPPYRRRDATGRGISLCRAERLSRLLAVCHGGRCSFPSHAGSCSGLSPLAPSPRDLENTRSVTSTAPTLFHSSIPIYLLTSPRSRTLATRPTTYPCNRPRLSAERSSCPGRRPAYPGRRAPIDHHRSRWGRKSRLGTSGRSPSPGGIPRWRLVC